MKPILFKDIIRNGQHFHSGYSGTTLIWRVVKPSPPPTLDYTFVDLGLPSGTYWATSNLGTLEPTEIGHYLQWGSNTTLGTDYTEWRYIWKNAPHNAGYEEYNENAWKSLSSCTQYKTVAIVTDDENDDKTGNILNETTTWDACYLSSGAKGYTPNSVQLAELVNNTIVAQAVVSGVSGYTFTSKYHSDKYIFIPNSGYVNDQTLNGSSDIWLWGSNVVNEYGSEGEKGYALQELMISHNQNRYPQGIISEQCSAYGMTTRPVKIGKRVVFKMKNSMLDTDSVTILEELINVTSSDFTESSNLGDEYVSMENGKLSFKKHFEGELILYAKLSDGTIIGEKHIEVTCGEEPIEIYYTAKDDAYANKVDWCAKDILVYYTIIEHRLYKLREEEQIEIPKTSTRLINMNLEENQVTKTESFIDNTYEVTVNFSYTQKGNIYGFVDLDLPSGTLWLNRNAGASTVSDYGNYYQWGDTVGYTDASHSTWSTAPFNGGASSYDATYWSAHSGECVDSNGVLLSSADAVYATTDGYGCLPSSLQYGELNSNTTKSLTKDTSGVYWYVYTSLKDSSKLIRIPVIGEAENGSIIGKNQAYYWWENQLLLTNPRDALVAIYNGHYLGENKARAYGYTIRGVWNGKRNDN